MSLIHDDKTHFFYSKLLYSYSMKNNRIIRLENVNINRALMSIAFVEDLIDAFSDLREIVKNK